MNCERLVLGAAQLGMPYGVANDRGLLPQSEVTDIVGIAYQRGVQLIDTAQAYGLSEKRLGVALADLKIRDSVGIFTKLDPELNLTSSEAVALAVQGSMERLGIARLEGILLHRESDLGLLGAGLDVTLSALKSAGMVRFFGVSVYSVESARMAAASSAIDVVQLPGSALDRRMLRSGVLAELHAAGKKVFIRSIYLQGLLLMSRRAAGTGVPGAARAVAQLEDFCCMHRVDIKKFLIDFVRWASSGHGYLVLGAESRQQLEENCERVSADPIDAELFEEWNRVWPDDLIELIDPRYWAPQDKSRSV
jgi:aryl-alcohol dehydrogenase-like predicted oxidoreductase